MRSVSCSWVCRREGGQQFSRELSRRLGARFSFPNDFYGQECAFAFFPPFLLRLFHNISSVSKVMGLNAPATHGRGCSYTVGSLLSKRRPHWDFYCFGVGSYWDPSEMTACSLLVGSGAQDEATSTESGHLAGVGSCAWV